EDACAGSKRRLRLPATRSSHGDLRILAHLRPGAADRGGGHLDVADDSARTVPVFRELWGDFQDTDRWIVWIFPPRLRRSGPQIANFLAVVQNLGGAGYRNVFLVLGIGERQTDV